MFILFIFHLFVQSLNALCIPSVSFLLNNHIYQFVFFNFPHLIAAFYSDKYLSQTFCCSFISLLKQMDLWVIYKTEQYNVLKPHSFAVVHAEHKMYQVAYEMFECL